MITSVEAKYLQFDNGNNAHKIHLILNDGRDVVVHLEDRYFCHNEPGSAILVNIAQIAEENLRNYNARVRAEQELRKLRKSHG